LLVDVYLSAVLIMLKVNFPVINAKFSKTGRFRRGSDQFDSR